MSRRRQWGEDSTVRVDLSAGAHVTLAFKGNLFDLTGDERALVDALSNVIQKHREVRDAEAKASLQSVHVAG